MTRSGSVSTSSTVWSVAWAVAIRSPAAMPWPLASPTMIASRPSSRARSCIVAADLVGGAIECAKRQPASSGAARGSSSLCSWRATCNSSRTSTRLGQLGGEQVEQPEEAEVKSKTAKRRL
jgi:hypothetical protein